MPCPLRLSLSLAVATLTLAGCGDTVNPGVSVLDAGSHADAGTPMDVVAPVDHGPPTLDSGCPAPQTITPAQVPGGFLAPSNVRFIRDIDGDTAIFSFAVQGETTVRFEWVNTEESHAPNPADNTAFGIATSAIVVRYLSTGGAFVVVRHASPTAPTMPNLDTFGRTLGLVFIDGELFQERLVREGLSRGPAPGQSPRHLGARAPDRLRRGLQPLDHRGHPRVSTQPLPQSAVLPLTPPSCGGQRRTFAPPGDEPPSRECTHAAGSSSSSSGSARTTLTPSCGDSSGAVPG